MSNNNVVERTLTTPAQLHLDEDGDYESDPCAVAEAADVIYLERRHRLFPEQAATQFALTDSAFIAWRCKGKTVITVNEIDLPGGADRNSVYVITGFAVESVVG